MAVSEDLYFIILGLVTIPAFTSWIGFARFTMARIERQMVADGLPRPSEWDGIGLRVLWYASAIGFPVGIWNLKEDPFINVPMVRRYATHKDRVFAIIFMSSNALFLLVGLSGSWVFGIF